MKVLVTGAAGFIGAALAKKLLERGDEVVGVDNFTPYYDVQLKRDRVKDIQGDHSKFQFEELNLAHGGSLKQFFKAHRFHRVAHMAAQAGVRYSLENPQAYVESNLVGFVNLLEEVRHQGTEHFVFASSSSVYGANTKMPFAEIHGVDHPVSMYAATKKCNEALAHSYSHLYSIPSTGLRFFTVYGPWGRPDMAVFKFTEQILRGEAITVFNHGLHHRDFTYVDDIIEGVVRTIDRPATPDLNWKSDEPNPATSSAPYRIYNIGNHSPVLLKDFISTLETVIGKKAVMKFADIQPGDVPDTFASVDLLKRDMGFNPKTPLKVGLSRFFDWYKSYYRV